MSDSGLTIGELAARFGLATHVLRHWEDLGLLAPRRDSGGRRVYRADDAETVAVILLGKRVGLSLAEIARLFESAADREARRELLRAHRDQLAARIAAATAALHTIEHALDCGAPDFRSCPHFRGKVDEALRLGVDGVVGHPVDVPFSGR
ncbi:DNA-binding transcriptional regulator, MerR family [Nocardia amikacinitolerans]|uniref:MerR family transcriptional regulator n=1 Tax=Nocardia amikacinitolerans TaxID=756689 RepID=UPI0008353850|nr:MerR family transcriptional regulator [Nocardia amikacinitolerans]MCP2317228.1 DNA-binding transcriptional regulator, MerR family [Nocardia amikacinitolerans]